MSKDYDPGFDIDKILSEFSSQADPDDMPSEDEPLKVYTPEPAETVAKKRSTAPAAKRELPAFLLRFHSKPCA